MASDDRETAKSPPIQGGDYCRSGHVRDARRGSGIVRLSLHANPSLILLALGSSRLQSD